MSALPSCPCTSPLYVPASCDPHPSHPTDGRPINPHEEVSFHPFVFMRLMVCVDDQQIPTPLSPPTPLPGCRCPPPHPSPLGQRPSDSGKAERLGQDRQGRATRTRPKKPDKTDDLDKTERLDKDRATRARPSDSDTRAGMRTLWRQLSHGGGRGASHLQKFF